MPPRKRDPNAPVKKRAPRKPGTSKPKDAAVPKQEMPKYAAMNETPPQPEPKVQVIEPDKPAEPIFDHSAPVGMAQSPHGRTLEQGGRSWTYAEFKKQTGRYEPEPRLIPEGHVPMQVTNQRIDRLLKLLDEIPVALLDAQEAIIANMRAVLESKGE